MDFHAGNGIQILQLVGLGGQGVRMRTGFLLSARPNGKAAVFDPLFDLSIDTRPAALLADIKTASAGIIAALTKCFMPVVKKTAQSFFNATINSASWTVIRSTCVTFVTDHGK